MSELINNITTLARKVAAEGIVLLENKDRVLPLKNLKVALFGRISSSYYKSGTGSGGLVNVEHVASFLEAALNNPLISVDKTIAQTYADLELVYPFYKGNGEWGSEPWSQVEFDISEQLISESASRNDVALVFIGRTAGEDRDNSYTKGSYLLTDGEEILLKRVCQFYQKVVVILNVGNVIDLSFMKTNNISGLVICWHGGQEGAHALFDVLTGITTPSGRLPDTIISDLTKHPSFSDFGNHEEILNSEDIYVGYRYFNTFAKHEIVYPFGYGLSYTTFKWQLISHKFCDEKILMNFKITNIGITFGSEVVQIYLKARSAKIHRPEVSLVAFAKTKVIEPNQSQELRVEIAWEDLATFDDTGAIMRNTFVLEKGEYSLWIGQDSIRLSPLVSIDRPKDTLYHTCEPLFGLNRPLSRFKGQYTAGGHILTKETLNAQISSQQDKIKSYKYKQAKYQANHWTLLDVFEKKIDLDTFIEGIPNEELVLLTRGEGMSSLKVTPGTAGAIGGLSLFLQQKGIPLVCLSDGPSGIRMDNGAKATSIPNGTLLASTFDVALISSLYYLVGLEMRKYKIDVLLGPGMNIHRFPLNGRNFEYFSEDPLLTGLMASSVIKGLHQAGVDGTLKHLCANNQETARFTANSVVSMRALREIYLKPFAIAIKNGARAIMTSYNPLNGIWNAGNFDLTTLYLREELGFDGLVMSDWWASINEEVGALPSKNNQSMMIKAQNDVYMVTKDPEHNSNNDNALESLANKTLSRAQLVVVVTHILNYIMTTPSFGRMHGLLEEEKTTMKIIRNP